MLTKITQIQVSTSENQYGIISANFIYKPSWYGQFITDSTHAMVIKLILANCNSFFGAY